MVLHILCGIPGSGKSTLVTKLKGYVVSTDSLRKFLWDDESVVKYDKLVFDIAKQIIDYMLKLDQNVILDATNLKVEKRADFIHLAKTTGADVYLHWVNCPIEIAIKRNASRERKVPVPVIKMLYKSFQTPKLSEGLDKIKIYNKELQLYKIITREITVNRKV